MSEWQEAMVWTRRLSSGSRVGSLSLSYSTRVINSKVQPYLWSAARDMDVEEANDLFYLSSLEESFNVG